MKRIFCTCLLALIFFSSVQAQVSIQVNIGSPPMWGPVDNSSARFYYIPDVEAYYDIETSMFIFYSGGVWIHHHQLPSRYRHYDLYNGYKVVLYDYHGSTPYTLYGHHHKQYAKGYRGPHQTNRGKNPGVKNSSRSPKQSGHSSSGKQQKGNKGQKQKGKH